VKSQNGKNDPKRQPYLHSWRLFVNLATAIAKFFDNLKQARHHCREIGFGVNDHVSEENLCAFASFARFA
jgi:hypothetical protein